MKFLLLVVSSMLLLGCAGANHMKHSDTHVSPLTYRNKISDVKIKLAPALAEELSSANNSAFKSDALLSVVRAELEKSGFYSLDEVSEGVIAEILIDDIRFLNSNVIMFTVPLTIFAGPDYISGKVFVLDKTGKKIGGADVKATWVIATGHQASEELRVATISQGFASEVVNFFSGQKNN